MEIFKNQKKQQKQAKVVISWKSEKYRHRMNTKLTKTKNKSQIFFFSQVAKEAEKWKKTF